MKSVAETIQDMSLTATMKLRWFHPKHNYLGWQELPRLEQLFLGKNGEEHWKPITVVKE